MATKTKDPLATGKTAETGGSQYEECTVKIIGMKLHEKSDSSSSHPLIREYDNIIELELGVQEGEYAAEVLKIYGFAKTQKGEWACYPADVRPLLREVLDRVREFEEKEEVFEGDFFPIKLKGKSFKIGLKHIESKSGGEYWFVETDYQKQQDEKKAQEYARSQEVADEVSAGIENDEEEVDPSKLPF